MDTPDEMRESLLATDGAERTLRNAGLSARAAKLLAGHGVRRPDELWAMTLTSSAGSPGLRALLDAIPGCGPQTASEIVDWWERGPVSAL